jgi:cysteine-rich repeat protein
MHAMCLILLTASVLEAQAVDPEVRRALDASGRVRVIVTLAAPAPRAVAPAVRRAAIRQAQEGVLGRLTATDFAVAHRFESVPGLAGTVTPGGLAKILQSPDVLRVDFDAPGYGALADSVPQIHADHVQDVDGFDGSGVTVAVLDSGFDSDHADLAGALAGEQCFCQGGGGCCPGGGSSQSGAGAAEDDQGHGTHVTGIITSNGVVASRGVAPGANIVAVKVLDSNNLFCCSSDVIAGLDWVATNRPDVKIVNMSLCTLATFPGDCDTTGVGFAWAPAINTLTANGVAVFAASCNLGLPNQMGLPACLANTISVGAVTKSDAVAVFSNSGPTLDLLAPGVSITAPYIGGGVASLSGTSMASPHAAGTAALLLDANPTLTPAEILNALKVTGVPLTDPKNGLTHPRIDAAAAVVGVTSCSNGAIDAGEECDDNNLIAGDGCSGRCKIEPCWVCSGEPSTCVTAPRGGCIAPGKSALVVKDQAGADKDKLVWSWLEGPATSHGAFGDPLGSDDYTLCVFDRVAGTPNLVLRARGPAGGTCAKGKPCWKQLGKAESPKGYRYLDRDLTPNGLSKLMLVPGLDAKSKVVVQGKGPLLALPGAATPATYFHQDANVTVQLLAGNGACWEAVFPASATKKNTAEQFKAVVP